MMRRFATLTACIALAVPAAAYAQAEPEEDGAVDLDAIDSLLGDQAVTGDEDMDGEAAADDAALPDSDDAATEGEGESDTTDDDASEDDEASDEEETPEPSDLTIAFNAYSLCSSEAGAALEETGFALDQIGNEALLRCSGQRAAYVNAFYFSLLPRYPDAPEAEVRASAERLVTQSDSALAALVTDEVTALRAEREAEADSDMEAEETETADDDNPENPDGESAEEEMEPDA
ncbi:MAG: hypothetical protein AAFW97_08135 [Pseudomonadota bacterium]